MSEFEVLAQQIRSCTLSEKRTTAVPGEGSQTADIMFIGEGPGFYEDRDGRPFVGPAGQLLDKLLSLLDDEAAEAEEPAGEQAEQLSLR